MGSLWIFRDFTGNSGNNIGYDYSGNQNNFSPDNFGGTGDGAIDSPTNNFTSFNKIMDYSLNADISEAGLRVEGPDSGHNDRRIYAPFAIPLTGKYYVECKFVKNGARGTIGFSDGPINGGGNGNNWFSFGFMEEVIVLHLQKLVQILEILVLTIIYHLLLIWMKVKCGL